MQTVPELLTDLFRGRPDVIAVAPQGQHFRPHKLDEPLPPEWVEKRHLAGLADIGVYPLLDDDRCWFACIDFDDHADNPDPHWREKLEACYYAASSFGIEATAEVGQSGTGGHLWVFFESPVPAYKARQLMFAIAGTVDVPVREIYPRQDRRPSGGYGNLIRLPLARKSYFFDPESGEPLEPLDALRSVRKIDEAKVGEVVYAATGSLPVPPAAVQVEVSPGISPRVSQLVKVEGTLLAKRWAGDMIGLHDRSTSALVQSIACELVRLYCPTEEIVRACQAWCREHNYENGEREQWVRHTVEKAYSFIVQRHEASPTSDFVAAAEEYFRLKESGALDSIPFGIDPLDRSIDGVGRGQVCVIAARPSHGKSLLALQWSIEAAKMGKRALFVSEEMSVVEIGQRVLSRVVGNQPVKDPIHHVRKFFAGSKPPIIVTNTGDIEDLERTVEMHVRLHNIEVVVVDYLQLLRAAGSRYEAVTEISRRLKQLAGREQLYLMVLSQMNRAVEHRDGRQPNSTDLRESGQIEQDADLVIFLTWPCKYDASVPESDYVFHVCKRRNGPIRNRVVQCSIWPDRAYLGEEAPPLPPIEPEAAFISPEDL